MNYLLAFLASFALIGLKATQQRHVQFAEYRKMPAVSYGMAFCEVFIAVNVVRTADSTLGLVLLALAVGTGAALGSVIGTYLHASRRS